MEPVDIGAIFLGHRQQIDGILAGVDDRSALDAEF